MILFVPDSGRAQLLQSDDLQRLHCEIATTDDAGRVRNALDGIASLHEGHAWISTDWLRQNGTRDNGPDWSARFETMIDKARPHGWISTDGKSVKAHIVWNNPQKENE